MCSDHVSETAKGCVQESMYYAGYFAMRFYQHLEQETGDTEAATWKSISDVFAMLVIALAFKVFEKILLHNIETPASRNAPSLVCGATLFAYSAYQQGLTGVADTVTYTAASVATQKIVEKVGQIHEQRNLLIGHTQDFFTVNNGYDNISFNEADKFS